VPVRLALAIIVGQVVRGNELQSWYVTRTLCGLNGSV
jgi:hypothetical protein